MRSVIIATISGTNKWTSSLLKSYVNTGKEAFNAQGFQFLALSTDGIRIGGRERLLTALCLPEKGVCYWSAPRARNLADPIPFESAVPKTQKSKAEVAPPILADSRRFPPISADSRRKLNFNQKRARRFSPISDDFRR